MEVILIYFKGVSFLCECGQSCEIHLNIGGVVYQLLKVEGAIGVVVEGVGGEGGAEAAMTRTKWLSNQWHVTASPSAATVPLSSR